MSKWSFSILFKHLPRDEMAVLLNFFNLLFINFLKLKHHLINLYYYYIQLEIYLPEKLNNLNFFRKKNNWKYFFQGSQPFFLLATLTSGMLMNFFFAFVPLTILKMRWDNSTIDTSRKSYHSRETTGLQKTEEKNIYLIWKPRSTDMIQKKSKLREKYM